MGVRRPPLIYRLVFTDPNEGDLVVRMRKCSMGGLIELGRLARRAESDDALEGAMALAEAFAPLIVEWNLDDESDNPVTPDVAGLLTLDQTDFLGIVTAYMEAVRGVSSPLGNALPPGDPSQAVRLPMEVLSPSLMS